MQFRLKTDDERKTPKIKSFTFISSLEREERFPLEFQNSKNELYVGYTKKFDIVKIVLDRHIQKLSGKSLNLYYWCGTVWKKLKILDHTHCLDISGNILFQIPIDWVEKNQTGRGIMEKLFYIKIIFLNNLNSPLTINEVSIGVLSGEKDFYINADCSLHLPRIPESDVRNINSLYQSHPNILSFVGNDGMVRNLTSMNVYNIERIDRNINHSIITMLNLNPEKIEEGFNMTLKNVTSNKFYLCTVIEKKWRYLEYK